MVKTYSDSTDKVEYVLCKNFYKGLEDYRGAHKLLNKLSLDSDERLPENLSYRIGDLCAYIAKDELLSGNYEESRNICENSYNNYPFSDPILPIQIASTILNGNYREANSLLDINRDKLIRINNGLETPNPSLENAWYFLQYDLCINIVEKLLQLTKQYGVDVPNWDYINQGTKQHKQLSKFNEFPDYDMIQVNPVKCLTRYYDL